MAGQRRGEPHRGRDRAGRGRRGPGLALPLLLALATACGDGGPTGIDRPGGNDGTSGSPGPAERLAGIWRTTLVIEVPGDIQTWTTTWRFEPDGDCHQRLESESLAEGFPRITERPCTFTADGLEVAIAFLGGGTVVLEYSFADFSPDRLILDGFEYRRIA
jgi:hypothetical protein